MREIETQLPTRIDCTHEGCKECAAQVVDGKLLFRARHNGEKHQVVLEVEYLLSLLTEPKQYCTGTVDSAIVVAQ